MDDRFRKAEQLIDEANSFVELLRAVIVLNHELFGTRPAVHGQMVKVMRNSLEHGADIPAKREVARKLVRLLQSQVPPAN